MITTRAEGDKVFILDDEEVVLKAYASPDGAKLRIFLPELENFAQTKIRPDVKIVDFDRDAKKARRETSTR